jgi:hypothetical protein
MTLTPVDLYTPTHPHPIIHAGGAAQVTRQSQGQVASSSKGSNMADNKPTTAVAEAGYVLALLWGDWIDRSSGWWLA